MWLWQTARMKMLPLINSWKVLVQFGSAQLIENQNGKITLRGGSKSDQIAAREWISLFLHEAVPQVEKN